MILISVMSDESTCQRDIGFLCTKFESVRQSRFSVWSPHSHKLILGVVVVISQRVHVAGKIVFTHGCLGNNAHRHLQLGGMKQEQ